MCSLPNGRIVGTNRFHTGHLPGTLIEHEDAILMDIDRVFLTALAVTYLAGAC